MTSRRDWLYRPVLEGILKAESLLDGSVDLAFISELNESLDVRNENSIRAREAMERK